MENKDILKKAIIKAKKNGFSCEHSEGYLVDHLYDVEDEYGYDLTYGIIFSHEFAKAFWKDDYPYFLQLDCEWTQESGCGIPTLESWEYHLQQMVLEKNPLTYLEKFL